MSDQDEQGNSDLSEDYSYGHVGRWELTVVNLDYLQSNRFSRIYKTSCEVSPSEWSFEMYLPEVREDGTCALAFLLERTDSDEDLVLEATIWIYFYDPSDNLIFNKLGFTRNGIRARGIVQQPFEMTPLPNMRDAVHQNAKVEVILMISLCHSYTDSDRDADLDSDIESD